jgi:hypothetical protein
VLSPITIRDAFFNGGRVRCIFRVIVFVLSSVITASAFANWATRLKNGSTCRQPSGKSLLHCVVKSVNKFDANQVLAVSTEKNPYSLISLSL